jgi:hypothetical protein
MSLDDEIDAVENESKKNIIKYKKFDHDLLKFVKKSEVK